MLKAFSKDEMLAVWRSKLGFDISLNECTVEQFELIDVNSIIARQMRLWYLNLLDTAPPHLLPTEEIDFTAKNIGNCTQVELPESCRRVACVTVGGWPADIKTSTACLSRMSNSYTVPHAVISGRTLFAGPCPDSSALKIIAVCDPGESTYILDESLLSTIPEKL